MAPQMIRMQLGRIHLHLGLPKMFCCSTCNTIRNVRFDIMKNHYEKSEVKLEIIKQWKRYMVLLTGYMRIGPLILSVRMLPKTSSANSCILLLGMRRFIQGWGTSHNPFSRSFISDKCTLSRKFTKETSEVKRVDGIYCNFDSKISIICI